MTSGDAGSPKDAATPACPNVAGAYAVVLVDATGCGDLSITAPQCIQQDPLGCAITFVSDATTATLTVDCGGTGSVQSCIASLRRTGARCS